MTYNQDIALELNTNTSYIVVGAKQGDYNSRTITATILQNGELCHFGDNTSASYRIRRPDGYANWAEATILPSRSRIQITLSAADLEVAGRCYADILIKDGSESLGTTNFVIDVQAAPNIAESAVQSQAFSYLQNMVYDADKIIESAQAWTEGKRGTIEVIGDGVKIYTNSSVFDRDENENYNFDFEIFKNQIEPLPIGETKVYTFVYTIDDENNGYWQLGNQRIDDISQYGIILNGTPDYNDIIQITASFADPTWHNNAKWYMEALQNASVGTVTTAEPGTPGDVTADYDGEENAFTFNFDLPSIKPHASISVNTINAFNEETKKKNDASAQVLIRNCDAQGNIIEDENSLHKLLDFSFIIPRGEPAGISDHVTAFATSEGLVPGDNAVVQVTAAGPDTAKEFTFNFQIPPGAPGDPPTFSINSVTSVDQDPLHPDVEVASVEAVQSDDKKTVALSFTLPKGLKGDPGKDGTDGKDGKDGINGTGQVNYVMGLEPIREGIQPGNVLKEEIFNLIYPIGSIYITAEANFSPSSAFGGTWDPIEDVFLAAAGNTYKESNEQKGSSQVNIDFSNGAAKIGFNSDRTGIGLLRVGSPGVDSYPITDNFVTQITAAPSNGTVSTKVALEGTQTIDIIPPYIPLYVWKRTGLYSRPNS